ncbi:hypothetical protein HHK36_009168 [Tetracentron sinense]|uniref:SnoaL-like domain-containing protein n=1 Tax=Tetracentron sinense TaxID=13715 RepID=A0A834ZIF6_TETSI|nr:hypothetical protein HHK36_009168 [Tetracentron sinense]
MLSRPPLKVGAVVMSLEPFGPEVYSSRYVEDNDFKHTNQWLKEDCDIVDGYHLEDDLLYKDGKLCVPKDSRLKLICEAHTSLLAGHFGVLKTVANLRSISKPNNRKLGLYTPLPVPDRPWKSISMDFLGGIPPTRKGKRNLYTQRVGLSANPPMQGGGGASLVMNSTSLPSSTTSPFYLPLKRNNPISITVRTSLNSATEKYQRRPQKTLIRVLPEKETRTLTIAADSGTDVVRNFYGRINAHDLASVEDLIAENCVYEDLVFPQPFVGRKAILEFFKKFTDSISTDLQFVIDDISDEDSSAVGVTWHLGKLNNLFSYLLFFSLSFC